MATAGALAVTGKSFSQANQDLSNLTSPTAANVSISPGVSNSIDLGTSTKRWKNLHIGTGIYFKGILSIHAPGTTNYFAGNNAGNPALAGFGNSGFGCFALQAVSSGRYNTASGYAALNKNTEGNGNTAYGYYTLFNNISGYSNVAAGDKALYHNTDRSNLVAIGDSALFNNGTSAAFSYHAIENTAIGSKALYANTSGYENTATGYNSLYSNTSGNRNTATGFKALYSTTTGYQNTANGAFALIDNTSGYGNAAFGYYTLYKNTTGYQNTAAGNYAMSSNTTGTNNTALGQGSLQGNLTGDNNVAIGFGTGNFNDNNTYCTFVGNDADQAVSTDFTNSTAIGNAARITASNQVRIGNSSVTSIGGYAGWTNISDGRIKKNIKANVPGLQFINKLQPVTYNLNIKNLRTTLKEENTEGQNATAVNTDNGNMLAEKGVEEKGKIFYTGFIAQDVEKAAKEIGYDFSGVDVPENESGLYGLRYAEFVVPLVKAVQELSAANDELKNENEKLKTGNQEQQNEIDELQNEMRELKALITSSQTNAANTRQISAGSLYQNQPNPCNQSTIIKYTVPQQALNAVIKITNANGQEIKSISINQKGNGQVNIEAGSLTAGTYFYSLFADGKKIDTKQMTVLH